MPPSPDSISDGLGITSGARAKHPLLVWASLRPGATVALEIRKGQKFVGIVEAGTADGLIIWIRTEQNERKMVHFHDCESVQLIGGGR